MDYRLRALSLPAKILFWIVGPIALSLVFYLMLVVSYCIPIDWLIGNIGESAEVLANETAYPGSYIVANGSFDNWTTALMLNEAAQASGNPFLDALLSPFATHPEASKIELVGLLGNGSTELIEMGYIERYWHGYLVILKPLLIFFNLKQIRSLFQVAFAILLCALAIVSYKNSKQMGVLVTLSFAFALTLFGGWEGAITLPIFFSLAGSIAASVWAFCTKLSRWNLAIGFCLIGAITVYLDYLDNPLLTLCLPLIIVVLRGYWETPKQASSCWATIKKITPFLVVPCAAWLYGYAFLWVLKWVWADVFTGAGVILSSIDQVLFRMGASSSSEAYGTTPMGALSANLGVIGWLKYVEAFFVVASVVVWIVYLARSFKIGKGKSATMGLAPAAALAVVSLFPIVWILIASNHSQIHAAIIAYRTQLIFLCCWVVIAFLPVVLSAMEKTKK